MYEGHEYETIHKKEGLRQIFPKEMQRLFGSCIDAYDAISEIRIRAGKPIMIYKSDEELYLTETGVITKQLSQAKRMCQVEIEKIINQVCEHSPYAFEKELGGGYITTKGGHRIGIAGEYTQTIHGVTRMKQIAYLNIRLAHEVIGCADEVIPYLFADANFLSTMIVSPPGIGKTTLLRDLIRQISDGCPYSKGMNVGLVDERSELAGCYQGVAQNNVGMRTDVLDGFDKPQGIVMLLKSMSPQIIAVDEIASNKDVDALEKAAGCGCKFLVTMHGTMDTAANKPVVQRLVRAGLIEKIIVLQKKDGRRMLQCLDGRGDIK